MKLGPLMALCIAALARPALAQDAQLPPITPAGQTEASRLMEPFFTTLQAGNAVQAYNDLFKGTLLETKTVEVGQLAAQTTFMLQTYGAVASWELIKSECATDYICKLVYVMRMEKGPVSFWAYVYRQPSGNWQPTYVLIGDTPQFLFD